MRCCYVLYMQCIAIAWHSGLQASVEMCRRLQSRIVPQCVQYVFLMDAKIMNAISEDFNRGDACSAHTISDTWNWLSNLVALHRGRMRQAERSAPADMVLRDE